MPTPAPSSTPPPARSRAADTAIRNNAMPVQRDPFRLIALLVAMAGVGSLSLNILVPALPAIAARLETDPGQAQLTVSLYLLGLAGSQLLLGPLSDRLGRRP